MYNINDWEKAAAFHGHTCGGLAIGFKAVEALREKFPYAFTEEKTEGHFAKGLIDEIALSKGASQKRLNCI